MNGWAVFLGTGFAVVLCGCAGVMYWWQQRDIDHLRDSVDEIRAALGLPADPTPPPAITPEHPIRRTGRLLRAWWRRVRAPKGRHALTPPQEP